MEALTGIAKLKSVAVGLEIPEEFFAFLTKSGVGDCESLALMAANELGVRTDIIEVAKAGSVKLELKGVVGVTKLWLACRKIMDSPALLRQVQEDPKPSVGLPVEVETDLKKKWVKKHGFTIPDAWLVNEEMQKNIWKDVMAEPPKVDILLLEQLRLATSLTRSSCTLLKATPGMQVEATSSNAEMIGGPMEVFMRARAWFITTSFCSSGDPDFLSLKVAIFGSDKIMNLALQTDKGQHPPTNFLAAAWAQTIQYFGEQVRISGKPLADFVQNTGAWEHKWTWKSNYESRGSNNRESDVSNELAAEMKRLRVEAKANQAANDRLREDLRSAGLESNRLSENGEGKGGKNNKYGKNGKNTNGRNGKNTNGGNYSKRSRSRGNRDRRDNGGSNRRDNR